MQFNRRWILASGASVALAGCAAPKFKKYDGPQVTKIEVHKDARRMYLLHGTEVLKAYKIKLGFTARGPKQFQGDGKTPEGRYHINRRNPDSRFYLSLGIDYPNARDRAYAESKGRDPGGDIFIHGGNRALGKRSADWTAGCIAVSDRQMRDIYAMVGNGTTIDIFP